MKETPNSPDEHISSLINKDQSNTNSNNTHGYIYTYARPTGSPQPF
jgi:hypothetical protein